MTSSNSQFRIRRLSRWSLLAAGTALCIAPQTAGAATFRTVEIVNNGNWHWVTTTLSEAHPNSVLQYCHSTAVSVNLHINYRVSGGNFYVRKLEATNNVSSKVTFTQINFNHGRGSVTDTSDDVPGKTRAVITDFWGDNITWSEPLNDDELLSVKVQDTGPNTQNANLCTMAGSVRFRDLVSDGGK